MEPQTTKAAIDREGNEAPSGDAVERRGVLVVGMHRGGTSAVAGALSFLGATMPRTPLPPGWKGEIHWGESEPIVDLHEELLASAGSSWHDVAPFPAAWYGSPAADEYRARMVEIVADEYGDSNLFVVKDPRICRLVPFWIAVLEELEARPAFVLSVRNPLEVAASLARRNEFSTPKSLLLWLRHVLDAEHDTREHRRALVAYEDLLSEPHAATRAICDRLGLDDARLDDNAKTELQRFISSGKRHHSVSVEAVNAHADVGEWVRQAYAAVFDACRSRDEPDYDTLDRLGAALANAERAYGPLLAESQSTAEELREQVKERDRSLAAAESRHQRTAAELRATEERLQATERRLNETEKALAESRARVAGARRGLREARRREATWARIARGIERSRTWRLGNLLIRALRLLTVRRPVPSQGPGELAARIESADTAGSREWDAIPEPRRRELETAIQHAEVAMEIEDWDEAVARWRTLLGRFGDETPIGVYGRLTQALRLGGDEGAAGDVVARARERFPDRVGLHTEFAELAMAAGDWDEAVARWRAVLDRFGDETPAGVYRRLSQAYRFLDDQDSAAETVRQGLGRYPDELVLHVELAELAMATGDWDEAARRWRSLLDRFGDDAPTGAQVALIRALLNAGDQEAADAVIALRAARQLDDYQDWIIANDLLTRDDRAAIRERIDSMAEHPRFSILMPVYNTRPHHLRQALDSVLAQLYPHWELCAVDDASTEGEVREILEAYAGRDERIKVRFEEPNRGIAGATNAALELADGDWIALLDHDDVLAEHALYLMAEAIAENPSTAVLYSDSDHLDERERRVNPYFKPDWDPDLFLGQNYITHLSVYRADLARAIGGFREGFEGSQDWDFALRAIQAADGDPVHVPHVLYHWRISRSAFSQTKLEDAAESATRAVTEHLERTGLDATVEPAVKQEWQRVRWALPSPPPLVSLVIPTRDRLEVLRVCVDGALDRTDYPAVELVVVDNGSHEAATLEYLEGLSQRDGALVVRDDGDFKFSRLCNRGVAAAHGEVVLLLNNDIEVIDPGWLRELVGHAMRPEVGAVGAKLYYENDSIQHAGVILGVGRKNGVAGHAYRFLPRISEENVPFGRTRMARNYSAVTAACMALRRRVYEEVGGLDEENLPVSFNDVDLCLRIRGAGYRVVWTPFAELYHRESLSRGIDTTAEDIDRVRGEIEYMHTTWGDQLTADPFFNPNLSLTSEDFRLATPTRAPKPWRDRIDTTREPPPPPSRGGARTASAPDQAEQSAPAPHPP